MTRGDALRTLFLAPLGALFGAIAGRKPEPVVAEHAEHVALVVDEASEIESGAFFIADDGVYVWHENGSFVPRSRVTKISRRLNAVTYSAEAR